MEAASVPTLLPLFLASLPISFLLSFAIGANDVANSFGTSFGSGVLTLRQCCILATIFETLGAILLGHNVSETVRKGVFDVSIYEGEESVISLGYFSALVGSALWNLLATLLRLPVSGTHSILGAILGFTLVAKGVTGIKWVSLGKVVASWFISPLASGIVCIIGYYLLHTIVLKKKGRRRRRLLLSLLPAFFGLTVFINSFSILFKGPSFLTPFPASYLASILFPLTLSILICAIVWLLVHFLWVPRQTAAIERILSTQVGDRMSLQVVRLDNNNPLLNKSNTEVKLLNKPSTEVKSLNKLSARVKPPLPPNFNAELTQKLAARNMQKKKDDLNGTNGHYQTTNVDGVETQLPDTPFSANGTQLPDASLSTNGTQLPVTPISTNDIDPADSEPNENECSTEEHEDCDTPDVAQIFRSLQILTSCFGSFAHGANDVSNAIGPLIAMYLIYMQGNVFQVGEVPFYLLLFGGSGISVGLWVLGSRVIKTIGRDLTPVTPSSGFTIELTASLTVLMASKFGFPISTTHCKVGSVVSLGWIRKKLIGVRPTQEPESGERSGERSQAEEQDPSGPKSGVNWKLFLEIGAAWVLTLPVSAAFSALTFYLIGLIFPSLMESIHDTPFYQPVN